MLITTLPFLLMRMFGIAMQAYVLTLTENDNSFDFTLMGEPEVSTTSVGEFERK